jgi:nicotinamide mononucleotide transporter
MSYIEIIAVFFSLISVILTAKNKIWCWPVGIIGAIFYGILFYQNQIWANMVLQSIFISQSIYGWYKWRKKDKKRISWLRKSMRTYIIATIGLSTTIIYMILLNYGDNSPLLDSITTTLSLTAMMLMAYRKMDSWVIWIISDIIFICLFISAGLYLSAFIYFIFLINAIFGLINWSKIKHEKI